MKLEMKMTDKDKTLLIRLAMLLIIVIFGAVLIYPLMQDTDAEIVLRDEQMELQLVNEEKVMLLPNIRIQNEAIKKDLEEARNAFYPYMGTSKVDELIGNIVKEQGVTIRDFKYDIPADYVTLAPYDIVVHVPQQESDPNKFSGLYAGKVTLTLKGRKENLQRLVDELFSEHPAIRVTSLTWDKGNKKETEDSLDTVLNLVLEVYMYANNAPSDEAAQ